MGYSFHASKTHWGEDSKCYVPANAFLEIEKESHEKNPRWRVFAQYSKNNYLMCRSEEGNIRYAPLCIYITSAVKYSRLMPVLLDIR